MVSRRKNMKKIHNRKSKKRSRKNILDGGDDINIIIRDFEGRCRYEISVNTDDTIKQLIEKCKEKSPIDKEFQYILALGGKILSEEKPISEYGIITESTLDLMKKKLPPPVVGMWVLKSGKDEGLSENIVEIIILNENETGFAMYSDILIKSDLTWNYNKENNLLKIKIPYLTAPEGYGVPITVLYFINPLNCYEYIDCIYWNITEVKNDTIETFVPKKSGYHRTIKHLSIIDYDVLDIFSELYANNNLYFFEHIIKIFKYMNKGVYNNLLNFDNSENMINSIKFLFNGHKSLKYVFDKSNFKALHHQQNFENRNNYKELMKIINRIPEMDIF